MAEQESKIIDPKANVVNKVTITHNNADLLLIEIGLCITVIICLDLLEKYISNTRRCLRKNILARQMI